MIAIKFNCAEHLYVLWVCSNNTSMKNKPVFKIKVFYTRSTTFKNPEDLEDNRD